MRYQYEFKNDSWGCDWQAYESKSHCSETVAEEIAENHWSSDPSDPSRFKFYIEIRKVGQDIERFKVTAEPRVVFYANKEED